MKNFDFSTLKVMKTCLVIRFLAVICPGIRFFWEILPGLSFALATHLYLLLLGSCPAPPTFIQLLHECSTKIHTLYLQTQHASIAT